jgi:hypothetical protein
LPFIARIFAASSYNRKRAATAANVFEILQKIHRVRMLAKDFDGAIDSARALPYTASIVLLVRCLAGNTRISAPALRRRRHVPLR